MLLMLKSQGLLLRRFKMDLWGKFLTRKKYNNLNFLIYSFLLKNYFFSKKFKKYFNFLNFQRYILFLFKFKNKKFKSFLLNSLKVKLLKSNKKFISEIFKQLKLYRQTFYRFLKRQKRRTEFKKFLINKYLFQCFYGNISALKLKKFFKLFKNQIKSNLRFFYFLSRFEFKLDVILYRANFVEDIKEAQFLIKNGYIFVNNKQIKSINKIVTYNDFISVSTLIRKQILFKLLLRCLSNRIIRGIPRYLCIDYKYLNIIPLEIMDKFDIQYLTNIDLSSVLHFYKK